MGLPVGTQITVDNAMKMMMVKSANDVAVVIAEGVSGSIEKFADEMNANAARLGMTQTHYVNPNGLPAEGHVSSARDQAILARAIIRDLPEYEYFVHLPAIKFGRRTIRNYNTLIGRYAGADGMKTGFICASGFNLVASATRNGKRIIAVVLGAPSSSVRALKAAQLMERGFSSNGLAWLTPSLGTVDALVPVSAEPPNLREEMCGPKRKRPAADSDDADDEQINAQGEGSSVSLFAGMRGPGTKWNDLIGPVPSVVDVYPVYTGPARPAAVLASAPAFDKPKVVAKKKPAAKPTTVAAKPADAKPVDAKPAAAKPVAAKPAAKPAASQTASAPAAAKPAATAAQPVAATKPAPKPAVAAVKPADAKAAAPAKKPAATTAATQQTAAAKPAATKPAAKPAAKPKTSSDKTSDQE
jgi:D-alanyl-D-alanine carboxypeptidase